MEDVHPRPIDEVPLKGIDVVVDQDSQAQPGKIGLQLEVEQDCFFPLLTGTRVFGPGPVGGLITGQGSAPWP